MYRLFALLALAVFFSACSKDYGDADVVLHTKFGDISLKLYEQTPHHAANFLALARAGAYDGVTFHRVVEGFMIQSGDPNTATEPNPEFVSLAAQNPTLAAEITPGLFHRRGVLAAARQPDQMNPERRSSALQFYIVTGRVWNGDELDQSEINIFQANRDLFVAKKLTTDEYRWALSYLIEREQPGVYERWRKEQPDSIARIESRLQELENELLEEFARQDTFRYSDDQRAVYTDIGGAAGLDGQYTIFGEVISGMEAVSQIEKSDVQGEKPLDPVVLTVTVVAKEGKYGLEKLPKATD